MNLKEIISKKSKNTNEKNIDSTKNTEEKILDKKDKLIREKEEKIDELIHIIEENELVINHLRKKLEVADDIIYKLKFQYEKYIKYSSEVDSKINVDIKKEKVEKSVETLILGTNKVENNFLDLDREQKNSSEFIQDKEISEPIEDENDVQLMDTLNRLIIEKDNSKIEFIIDKIIKNINKMESNLDSKDLTLIMYISFFYNMLDSLLNKSKIVGNYFKSWSFENILLKLLIEEKNCESYVTIGECAREYMSKNELFTSFNEEVKTYIIKNIEEKALKVFEQVYNINDIELGDKTENIKAWARKNNSPTLILVEGLYSKKNNRLYLIESVSFILKLNIGKK